jgi:hypothetical protein
MGRFLLVVAMVVACGKVNLPTQEQCESPQLLCGTACVAEQTDPANCGACGTACDSTQTCAAGQCITPCDPGLSACTTGCVDEQTDPMNCGACGSACVRTCEGGTCPLGYFALTGTPNPATVFNTIVETYSFPNNLTNSIWYRPSNEHLTGEFSTVGYWEFAETTTGYATTPDHATTDIHARMVLVPSTNTVIYSSSPSANGVGLGTHDKIMVAPIDRTGVLGTGVAAAFSDSFVGSCQLLSSSATQLLCFDGTTIRRYTTTTGTATLTFVDTVPLSVALPTAAACAPAAACYGSTFAFDGMFYYFASDEGLQTNLNYVVYDVHGTFVNTYVVAGNGAINGVYFDWSVGRYAAHDGYGGHTGGTVYTCTGPSDTQTYSPISSAHTLI